MGSGRGMAIAAWLALAALGGCRPGGAVGRPDAALLKSVVGTCAAVQGKVEVRRVGYFYWEPVAVGSAFRAGDWLRTEALSTARIEFLAGSGLDVGEATTVIVDAGLMATGRGHPLVSVETGATEFSVRPSQGPIGLKNPDGSVTEVDTALEQEEVVFRVEREGDRADLAVASGVARVTLDGRSPREVAAREVVRMSRRLAEEAAEQVLAAPAALEPEPDARIPASALPASLRWAPVDEAVGYRFQVARDARFRALVAAGLTEATQAALPPGPPGPYFWRVASRDAAGRLGLYGAASRLFIEGVPEDKLLGPEDDAVLQVLSRKPSITFSWRSVPEATAYRLVVARSADLAEAPRTLRTAESRLEVGDLALGRWYWGVWAEGAKAAGGRPLFARPYRLTLKLGKAAAAPRIEAPKTIEWK